VESEGFEEKYRAVIKGAVPAMNRSAKGEARSSLHYGGEGVLIHSPHTAPRCLRTARYGRFMRDPRRAHPVFDWHRSKQPYKQTAKWEATPSESSDNFGEISRKSMFAFRPFLDVLGMNHIWDGFYPTDAEFRRLMTRVQSLHSTDLRGFCIYETAVSRFSGDARQRHARQILAKHLVPDLA
jgi:hypothetical protein